MRVRLDGRGEINVSDTRGTGHGLGTGFRMLISTRRRALRSGGREASPLPDNFLRSPSWRSVLSEHAISASTFCFLDASDGRRRLARRSIHGRREKFTVGEQPATVARGRTPVRCGTRTIMLRPICTCTRAPLPKGLVVDLPQGSSVLGGVVRGAARHSFHRTCLVAWGGHTRRKGVGVVWPCAYHAGRRVPAAGWGRRRDRTRLRRLTHARLYLAMCAA